MRPAATRELRRVKRAKKMTTRPAVLKKTPLCWLLSIENELKLISERTGRVPRAKAVMVRAPAKKLPLLRALSCMDWVKPQGRMKVIMPTMRGVRV